MDSLSNELLCEIFSYLDFKDLCRLSVCCLRLQSVVETESLWAHESLKTWSITTKESCNSADKTWHEIFKSFHRDFGKYIHCYKTIRSLWDQIFHFTQQHTPSVNETLLPGLSEDDLDTVEREMGVHLPLDYRCSYRMCNGQEPSSEEYGLFGCDRYAQFAHHGGHFLWTLKVLDDVRRSSVVYRRLRNTQDRASCRKFAVFPVTVYNQIEHRWALNECMVFRVKFPHSKESEAEETPDRDHSSEECERVKRKNPVLYPVMGDGIGYHVWRKGVVHGQSAGNFAEFLRKKLNNMRIWPVQNGRLLRFLPNNSATTGPFRVDVSVGDESIQNNDDHKCYGYRITMSMDANGSSMDSCQLETRHWDITDAHGQREEVEGPGVVGEYPVMRPGASHTWVSATSFETLLGTMSGHFMMRNLHTGQQRRIECPTMSFEPEAEKFIWMRLREEDEELEIEEGSVTFEGTGGLVRVKNRDFRLWLSDHW